MKLLHFEKIIDHVKWLFSLQRPRGAKAGQKASFHVVPELSFLPAPYSRWTRAKKSPGIESRITCMAMLRTNQSKITSPNHAARVNVSRNAFFSSRSLKENTLFDVDIVVKTEKRKNRNMVHHSLYSYRQRVSVITLFPNIVFVLFLYVERFCKSFWMESLTRASSSFA